MEFRTWLRATAAGVVLLFSGAAFAADVLIMHNGDRITGTISKIWDGEVYIEPPYADEIKVKLDKVKTIDARRDFEFEMWSGEKFTGQLGVDAQGKQLLVRDGQETPLDLAKVEELAEPDKPFDWEARVDLNGDTSSGNSDTANLTVQAYGMMRFGDHRHEGRFGLDVQERDNVRAKEQLDLRYDYNWLFGEHWYLAAGAGYRRDPFQNLTRRVTLGAGLGYEFYDDAHRRFRVSLGPAFVNEELNGQTTDTGAALWKLDFRHKFYRKKFEFFHHHDYLAYTGGTKNRVFDSSTGVRLEFTDDFYTNLQFDYDHQSKPSAGRDSTDTRFLIGLGLKMN